MITTHQMRELETNSRIPRIALMERAGKGVFEIIAKKYEPKNKKILIICYHGNNGGDGFVAADYLSEIAEVDVLFLGNEDRLKGEAAKNYERIMKNSRVQILGDYEFDFNDYYLILDAMLGTGLSGPLQEPMPTVVDMINESRAIKVSVDIPTGLNPDTGEVNGKMVNADLIITFHDLKTGLQGLKDKVEVVDIGIKS